MIAIEFKGCDEDGYGSYPTESLRLVKAGGCGRTLIPSEPGRQTLQS